jgi:hypothetical protein
VRSKERGLLLRDCSLVIHFSTQGAHDGVDLYRCFERLEYEALAKRKAFQDQNQFPDRYVKQSFIIICVSSLRTGEREIIFVDSFLSRFLLLCVD